MTGLGGFERHLHGFTIAKFADQDYARRLPKRGAQSEREIWCIAVQFALMDGRALVVVQEFDWIFNSDDVTGVLLVDAIEECGQS